MEVASQQPPRKRRFNPGEKDPNEYLIMLRASAVRMHWTPERERQARGSIRTGVTPVDAPAEFSYLAARSRTSRLLSPR